MRTLPLRLSPIDGESLPGYVARYAHTFGLPPGDVVRALGIDRGTGTVAAAGRYGVWLPAEQVRHAAFATGIGTDRIKQMLLERFAGRAFPSPSGSGPVTLAGEAQAHEVLIWSSRFCPSCLREDGAWLLRWQLAWSVLCSRHEVLLARRCPKCQAVPTIGPRGRWQQDHRGLLTDPARCAHRPERKLCRAELASTYTVSIADNAALLAAQRRIDALLDGQLQPALAGVELQPPTYLRDLLTLCSLLDRHAQPPTPGASPTRLGRRLHDHPADLAAVLPQALTLADLSDQDALAEALRELADQRYRDDGLTLLASKTGPMSEQLSAALQRAVSQAVWASASRQLGFHPSAHRRPDDLDQRLQRRHVPQLFWAEDYDQELAHLFDFDDFTHWLGRRFCSVLLARMLKPLSWDAAVRYLDFPERFINKGYNTTFTKLRANSRFNELAVRVKRIANQHAERGLIDYKQRRAGLADWNGIDSESWHLLEPRPRPLSPWRRVDKPLRRAQSSLWLWCHLTSGHERAAPFPMPTKRGLSDQTQFIRDALPTLRERLLILGELVLTTPAEARSTLLNRLAAALHQRGHLAENYYLDTIDPLITSRVLAHVSAHTGVDIHSLTTPSAGSHAPPAVTHARLLAAGLLRRTALVSWASVAAIIGGDANHIGENDRGYRAALKRSPSFAAELDRLVRAVENWHTPAPIHPTTPHHERMHDIAMAIKADSAELLESSHGPDLARLTSITLCRQHTDLTCYDIAAIHRVKDAQPSFARATVARYRRRDPDFNTRYRELLATAQRLQRQAGYSNANLTRGLTTTPAIRPKPDPGSNYVSHGQLH